jgi:hypothetical protein
MRCKSTAMIVETGYGMKDWSSVLCRDRKFVLTITSIKQWDITDPPMQ